LRTKLPFRLLLAAIAAGAILATPSVAHAEQAGGGGPRLGADSAILVDGRDGHVLYRRAAAARRPIASTTKLMTALLSVERLPLKRRLRAAPYQAAAAESQIRLAPGERMSVADLLRALMLESANDAAVTLARGAGGSVDGFVQLMNRRAAQLGLAHTHYANPVGLDEVGNYSSAGDLATLARLVLRNGFLAETADTPRARLLTGAHPRIVDNRNDLVGRVPWIDGLKTGHTNQAGYVLIGAGMRKRVQLVSVVLGTSSESARDADTLALLDYGFRQYRRVAPLHRSRSVAEAKVAFFGDRKVPIEPARTVAVSIRQGERVRTRIDAPGELHGPLAAGARVGEASVYVEGRRVSTVPLVTADSVPKAGVVRKVAHWVLRPWTFVALALLGLGLGARRRRLAAANAARRRRRQAARLD
jgi:serine-type D-Ala-D-Ala carboxypeptidase (penicillin-binding protein 5/6)